ncbi:MAG: glycoside hydrolase family 113 [Thermoleophilia bacterium]
MRRAAAAALLLGIIILALTVSPATPAVAQSSTDQLPWMIRGFNYPSWSRSEYLSPASSESLGSIAATGANWVAVVPTWYVDSVNSSDIAPEDGEGGRTATDAALVKAIDDAHARGLGVMLKPHVDVRDGTTRVDIRPADMTLWFADYRAMIVDYARLAEMNQVEMLAIGTELAGISGYENNAYWEALIAEVRTVYHGPITYAASMNDYRSVYFWDQLDYLGLDSYFPLSDNVEPTIAELVNGWTGYVGQFGEADWIGRVEAWQAIWNKPVIFTELGYRSSSYVGRAPWDCSPAAYDGENQARAYDAAFQVLRDKPWLAGVFWWDWMVPADSGGPGDTNYTVRDKPAEAVVTSWFTDGISPIPAIETSLVSSNWASYADYQQRLLSVTYSFANMGDGRAYDSAIVASLTSDGVSLATPLPFNLGLLERGASRQATLAYRTTTGVTSFHALTFVAAHDVGGNLHYFPEAPPA